MTDFALNHLGTWKSGQAAPDLTPKNGGAVYEVRHDQTSHAYEIEPAEYDDFQEWVANLWASDNEEQGENQSTLSFLEDINCQIWERF